MRRRLSVSGVRAQSSCLLSRLCHFGDGALKAAKRRDHANTLEDLNRGEMLPTGVGEMHSHMTHEQSRDSHVTLTPDTNSWVT